MVCFLRLGAAPARLAYGADERAHEFSVHLRRDGVHVDALPGKKFPGILDAVDCGSARSRSARIQPAASLLRYSFSSSAPAMQPTHSRTLWRISGSISPRVTTSETAKRPPGFRHAKGFAQHPVLVGRKIDDAIGDDHVDGVVGQRNVFDLALQELDVLDAGLALVLVGQRQHFVGHVETVGFAGGPDAARRKQNVDAAAGAEIEDDLAGIQLRQRRRIAAAERGQQSFLGDLAGLGGVVEVGGDGIAAAPSPAVAPQQELPPVFTRRAAWPYFSFTTSLMSVVSVALMNDSYLQIWMMSCGFTACCACSIRRRGIAAVPAARRCWRCSAGTCFPAALRPDLRSQLVEMVRKRRIGDIQFFLNLADHQALGMRGEQQLHDAQPRLGSHGGEHVGVLGDPFG